MTTKKTTPPAVAEPIGISIMAGPASALTTTYRTAFRNRDILAGLINEEIPQAISGHRVAEFLLATGIANTAVLDALAAEQEAQAVGQFEAEEPADEDELDSDPETCNEVSCRADQIEHDHGEDCTPSCQVCSPIGRIR